MSIDVSTEILINRPRDAVAAFASNPDNVPAWYGNIKSVEWKTPRPMRVGSRLAFVAHFLGRQLAYTYEFVDWVEGKRLVMRTSEGPFPMETTYIWEAGPSGGTRMVLRNSGMPSGFSRWLAAFMAVAVRRANRKDLALLKRHLESGAA